MEPFLKAHLTSLEMNTRLFENCLEGVDDATAQKRSIEDPTIKGALAFLLAHEAFHIGQLAFLRRYLSLGPMSYT